MNSGFASRAACVLLFAFALWQLSGCAVPLGPGYQIEREQVEIRYVKATPARLTIRAVYRLNNIGNRDLTVVEASLPDERLSGRQGLHAWVDGREVAALPSSEDPRHVIRIPFDPPWPQKRRREVVLEFSLTPEPPGRARLAVAENSFHLRKDAALPQLLPPKGSIIEKGKPVKETRISVEAPASFRIWTGASSNGTHRSGDALQQRFIVRKGDYAPSVVSGQYQEQQVPVSGMTVIFWSFDPIPADQAQAAAARLTASFQTYEKVFGPLSKKAPVVHLIETRAVMGRRSAVRGDAASVSVPLGALLNRAAFAQGVSSDAFLDLVERELARTWFGETVAPRPETEPVLGTGLAEYATTVVADARGGEPERRRQAARLLRWFDDARKQVADERLLKVSADLPIEQRVFAYSKGALFFLALEDRYGKEHIRQGLAHLVRSMRGMDIGYVELRSALELETKQDLADFFRLWLNETGIPADFRARYEEKAATQ